MTISAPDPVRSRAEVEQEIKATLGLVQSFFDGILDATLISAARWVVDGAKGELSSEAIKQLQQVVSDYDAQRHSQRPSKFIASGNAHVASVKL